MIRAEPIPEIHNLFEPIITSEKIATINIATGSFRFLKFTFLETAIDPLILFLFQYNIVVIFHYTM